jgi:hypothetical protein
VIGELEALGQRRPSVGRLSVEQVRSWWGEASAAARSAHADHW